MAAPAPVNVLQDVMLFLGTAGVLMPLVKRLKFSPTLGFLLAGIVLGPFVMGRLAQGAPALSYFTFPDADGIGHVGEFGVVFLFFMIGLELSLERVRILKRLVFGLGAGQFLFSTLAVGLVAWALGTKVVASLVIGAALAMSSTAIVVPALAERRKLGTASGRATFAVLLFQDLAVTPLLVMLALLGGGDGNIDPAGALWTLAQAAIGLVALIGVGRLALRPMFHSVALAGGHEFFMAASLLVVLGAAMAAQAMGLSMAIGAFVGGLLLAETEFRRQVEMTIDPFRGLLLGLFFIAIGAKLNLSLLIETPGQILLMTGLFVVVKAIVLYVLTMRLNLPLAKRREIAWLLAPGGEFAFVILALAMDSALIWPSLGGKLMVSVTLSMFLIPVFALVLDRLNTRAAASAATFDTPEEEATGRIIVIGYGRVGQLVGEMLASHKLPLLAVDMNQRNVSAMRAAGVRIYFGDPTVPAFMEKLPLKSARALVVTLTSPNAVESVIRQAREINPDLTIVARARDTRHASRLYELGVSDAVPETFEASLQLAEAVLVDVGVPMGLVIASVHDKRDRVRKDLQTEGHDVRQRATVRRIKPD